MVDLGKPPSPKQVKTLGEGWAAEEALAISVYCVLSTADPAEAMALAVNHSGDSDSTGGITGNLLGTALGISWLDSNLLAELEGWSVIEQVADALSNIFNHRSSSPVDWDRYPPW